MSGKLYGLGLGPGDPELITLKAHRILQSVPVIAWPAPDTGPSFARSIAAPYLPEGQIEVPIVVPMRTERFPARDVYDKASVEIAAHLDAGRRAALYDEICALGAQAWMTGTGPELFSDLGKRAQYVEVTETDAVSEVRRI